MKYVKTFESFKMNELLGNNNEEPIAKIEAVHNKLEEYIPPFKYADYLLDYDRTAGNEYNVWIEFTEVPTETISEFDTEYNKFELHFNEWNKKNNFELYLTQILTTDDSVTYMCKI